MGDSRLQEWNHVSLFFLICNANTIHGNFFLFFFWQCYGLSFFLLKCCFHSARDVSLSVFVSVWSDVFHLPKAQSEAATKNPCLKFKHKLYAAVRKENFEISLSLFREKTPAVKSLYTMHCTLIIVTTITLYWHWAPVDDIWCKLWQLIWLYNRQIIDMQLYSMSKLNL